MKRVTEPELMTDFAQVRAYAESDFSLTEENFIQNLDLFLKKNQIEINTQTLIVDLGCGPGNIAQRIAVRWGKAKVIGIDDSIEMIRLAKERREHIKNKLLSNGLIYKKINLSSIANRNSSLLNCADIVVSNSLIHHIHQPSIFFNALFNISKKGAIHFHRDLRRPNSIDEALEIQKRHLSNASSIVIRDFMASLSAAFTSKEIREYLKINKLDQFKVVEHGDRYLDISGVFL